MNVRETAQHYGVIDLTVKNWIKRGCPVETFQHGAQSYRKFNTDDVDEWLKSRTGKGIKKNEVIN